MQNKFPRQALTFSCPSRGGVILNFFFSFSGSLYVSKNLNFELISAVSTFTSSIVSEHLTTFSDDCRDKFS